MAEYISKDELKAAILKRLGISGEQYLVHSEKVLVDVINKMSPADVVERKIGKWIYPSDITGFGRCSECKALWDYSLMTNKYFKICPRCGSYNRGDDDV